ncbi:MAG: phosphoribosylanthranilate isomerase [Lachnospiraceae bacterium]|nr:phosphoribosylanthranilate isomerase [Lachnospiraceae bacterium]
MTKIKICGLTRPCDIDFVNEAKPDYIGFVFWKKSRRSVTREQAAVLKAKLDPDILAVGVFVDEKEEIVAELVNAGIIDLIQLHGTEDAAYVARLRKLTDKPIIKAFCGDQMGEALRNGFPAHYYLFDSGKGTGKIFDWDLVPEIEKPWFLAGGISAENVIEAIEKLHPYAVDFSSSVETNGKKDRDKILKIVRRIRDVER